MLFNMMNYAAALGLVLSFNAQALENTLENREREAVRYEKVYDFNRVINNMMANITFLRIERDKQNQDEWFKKHMNYLTDLVRQEYFGKNDQWFIGVMHQLMVQNLTANELKAAADFYETTEGQSILKKCRNYLQECSL